MIEMLLALFVAVPLGFGGLAAFGRTKHRWPTYLLMVTLVANFVGALALVILTRDGTVIAHGVGGWQAGIAIPFVVDMFSALMLAATGLLALVCAWFGLAADTGRIRLFAALVLVLVAGVNGALMTADIFNLFVFIEVMLLPSYGLLMLSRRNRGDLGAVTGSRLYVTYNLFVSTMFLAGVGLVYGVAGTVNLGELAGAAADNSLIAAAGGMCIFALAMKAAVVPSHGWLARTYPSTSPAITALFSGLHTKVSVYAIYRIYATVFDGDERYLWIGLIVFSATMLIGVLGAVGEHYMRTILSFHMVSQIGYILLGVALFTKAGLVAGLFYLFHNMVVKTGLFLSAGAIEVHYGTGKLDNLRGFVRKEPWVAVAFAMVAASMAGLPPFSGFAAKLSIILATIEKGEWIVLAVALFVSLITLMSMLKIWNAVFAAPRKDGVGGDPDDTALPVQPHAPASSEGALLTASRTKVSVNLMMPGLILAAITLLFGLGAEILMDLAAVAADGLLDTTAYVTAVLQ